MTAVNKIEGIGDSYAKKLKAIGVTSVEGLLKMGSTPKGREDLVAKSGIGNHLILKWVNHADLFRIKGVGGQYSELLEAAGVDTVVELSQRNGKNLLDGIVKTNSGKKLVRKLPTQSQVENWIAQAKKLPRVVNY